MKKRCLTFMLVMMMIIPPPICGNLSEIIGISSGYASALEPEKELQKVKVGDVAVFTGEVLVRINGRWSQLAKVPQPLYSSDKVVTRRGRAEINFADGGILRADLDTNISISQDITRTKTLFSEKVSTSRQVNVLVGNIWFDVKITDKDSSLKFKTPSMVAAIKGTSGPVKVALNGDTNQNITGDADIEGGKKDDGLNDISSEDINKKAEELPASDPEVDKSDLQKLAKQAASREDAAKRASEDANKRVENTKGKNDPAALALEASAKAEAEAARANAAIVSAEEILEEAKKMGDKDVIAKAEEFLNGIMDLADNAANSAQEAAKMSSAALSAKTPEEKEAYAAAAMAYASAAEANANAISAAVNVAEITVSDNDETGVASAKGEVEKAKNHANQATTAAKNANTMAEAAKTASNEESRQALSAAALANASAAGASAAASRANAVVAEALSAKSVNLVLSAQDAAGKAEDNAKDANGLAQISSEYAQKTAKSETEEERRANAAAAKANSSAAQAKESAADADAKVSEELLSGDEKKLAEAQKEAKDKNTAASNAAKAAEKAADAANQGNAADAEKAATEAETEAAVAETETGTGTGTTAPPSVQAPENIPGTSEPPVNDNVPASPY